MPHTRVIVFAHHDLGCACLREVVARRDNVVAVVTRDDPPAARRWFASVAETARVFDLPTFTPGDVNTPEWIARIRDFSVDFIYCFDETRRFAPEILRLPARGAVRVHAGLLPRDRGVAPLQWVLARGEHEAGVTLHHLDAAPYGGDIVAERRAAVDFEDTAFSLHHKLVDAARRLVNENLLALRAGAAPRRPQAPAHPAPPPAAAPDPRIDWSRPAIEIYNQIRALTHPFGGAHTTWRGRRVTIWQAHPVADVGARRPGVCPHTSTGDGWLRLERVQLDGAEEVDGAALPVDVDFDT